MRMSDWSSDVCSSDLARWLERAHHTSLAQYQAYLDYRPVAAADPALVLALIRASAPRSSDLGDHENRLLTIPDMGWQAFSAAPVQIRLVAGDHVTMLSGDRKRTRLNSSH